MARPLQAPHNSGCEGSGGWHGGGEAESRGMDRSWESACGLAVPVREASTRGPFQSDMGTARAGRALAGIGNLAGSHVRVTEICRLRHPRKQKPLAGMRFPLAGSARLLKTVAITTCEASPDYGSLASNPARARNANR
eukprot:gene13668-biopygen7402